jgi:hypothetical protein
VTARRLAIGAVVLLAALHQDVWLWDDPTLVLGILPAGLAWHAGFSVAAAFVWWGVARYAWPSDPFAAEGGPFAAEGGPRATEGAK